MLKKAGFKAIIILAVSLIVLRIVFVSRYAESIFNNTTLASTSVKVNNYDDYYNAVKKAMYNHENSITLRISNYDKNTYNLDVFKKILKDNPELQGICTESKSYTKGYIPNRVRIEFKYSDSKKNLQDKEKKVAQKIDEIVQNVIKPDMKDYEKEVALHNYLVNNTEYDKRFYTKTMPAESNTGYGVLINGNGACLGYSEAMYMLLKAVGIESIVVLGDAKDDNGWGGHAWNIVKIGGQYYHLDTTWDDPITKDGSNSLKYSYFNLTDNQIEKNHKWNEKDYPKCSSTTYSFGNLNLTEKDKNGNIVIVIASYNDFFKAIKNALINDNSSITLKITNYDANVYDVSTTVTKAYRSLSKSGKYISTYYNDEVDNSKYITLIFK